MDLLKQHSAPSASPVGVILREWRAARRMSQLDLALEAAVSTRHLSCVETGKSQPSREMVERVAGAFPYLIVFDVWVEHILRAPSPFGAFRFIAEVSQPDEFFVKILSVHLFGSQDLAHIGEAGDGSRAFSSLCEDREKYGGENRDNGDHYKQLNESKSGSVFQGGSPFQ